MHLIQENGLDGTSLAIGKHNRFSNQLHLGLVILLQNRKGVVFSARHHPAV